MKFTRYLYIRDEVEYSLLISLLASAKKETRESDEILFWAYELYFSGWEEDTLSLVRRIYEEFYKQLHPTLNATLNKKYKEWRETRDPYILGTILLNIIQKPYCADTFHQKHAPKAYMPENRVVSTKRSKYILAMNPEDLETYKTVEVDPGKSWQILRNVCRYSTYRENHKQSIFVFSREDAVFRFRDKWLYYAGNTPVWNRRIAEHGGALNHTKTCVDFPNDDVEEAFYERYNYEPDEQPFVVLENCVGQPTSHGELTLLNIGFTNETPHLLDSIRYFS